MARAEFEDSPDEEHERLRLVLEGTRLGTWDWNPQTGAVQFDARWAEMLGHTLDEIPMHLDSWSSRVHPDDLPSCLADVEAHIRGETPFYENVHRMRHASGRWVHILDRGKVVRWDAEGRAIRFTGTHTDITGQREAEQAALEASRAKSLFLARMSHEIRTPLNGILGILQLMDPAALDARHREYVHVLRDAGEGLLTIVNDILDVAKVEAGQLRIEPHPFDPVAAVRSVFDLFRERALDKGLDVSLEVSADVPAWAEADGHRIRQVLANLLSNAVKFTDRGIIRVRLSAAPSAGETVELCVAVEDTGPGIREPDAVWESFRQADTTRSRIHGGTGLGLAISRLLVELMGGHVRLETRLGVGSTFSIHVPVKALAGEPSAAEALVGLPVVPRALRVLVADDNSVNRMVVDGMLRRLGLSAVHVSDGQAAVDACARVPFDVVLMDVHMPVMDGLEASRRIRALDATGPGPVLVALSADALADNHDACRAAGMTHFVPKPLRLTTLAETLRAIAEERAGAS